ncbi:MAG: FHA domain-containing protein [Alphaproteobacteria bacterium]|nr:FHA domain-containing protein [Alphaproteobacteria bacterium]
MTASLRLRVHKGPLTETPPPPILLAGGPLSIGRRDDNGWVLPDATASVSRKHATVHERGGVWLVTDESANGTLHNGQLVGRGNTHPLANGDIIKIGDYEIIVEPAPDMGSSPGPGLGPAVQPLADPYGVGEFARADFGAPAAAPAGPSPFDPPPPERAAEAPPGVDLFGDFGARQVAPGIGVGANADAPVAAYGGLDAPVDPMAGGAGSPFAPLPGGASPPFGGAPAGRDDWGSGAPNVAPSAGALVNDPLSNPGGGSVFGDQFGSADAIRNPLAGGGARADSGLKSGDPFGAPGAPSVYGNDASPFAPVDPVGFGRDQAPAPLGFDAVSVPEIGGPGASSALPLDWNAAPSSGPAPPPPDLDPIEQALAGLKPADAPAAPARPQPASGGAPAAALFGAPSGMPSPGSAPRPSPAPAPPPRPASPPPSPAPPAPDMFGAGRAPGAPMEDAFAHPSVPVPSMPTPAKPGTPVGAPPPLGGTPSPAFQAQAPRPAAPAARPAPAAAPAGDAPCCPFMEGAPACSNCRPIDPAQAMRTLGASSRAIVSTLARLLEARRLLKGEFRITQTVVGARETALSSSRSTKAN